MIPSFTIIRTEFSPEQPLKIKDRMRDMHAYQEERVRFFEMGPLDGETRNIQAQYRFRPDKDDCLIIILKVLALVLGILYYRPGCLSWLMCF